MSTQIKISKSITWVVAEPVFIVPSEDQLHRPDIDFPDTEIIPKRKESETLKPQPEWKRYEQPEPVKLEPDYTFWQIVGIVLFATLYAIVLVATFGIPIMIGEMHDSVCI